jgi:CRP-like cAMP-binding protein
LKLLVGQLEQMKVRSGTQRIAQFILNLLPEPKAGPAACKLPFEKAVLASQLGMRPESFSRALARLRAQGITVEKETVHVADIVRLRRFIDYIDQDEAA